MTAYFGVVRSEHETRKLLIFCDKEVAFNCVVGRKLWFKGGSQHLPFSASS